ncbi:hypothetical protein V2I01_08565 [Micromonospora sp. BRA006-A]|nr:hypothetical protein [Micromonospora sp. BRA006-A]
MDTARALVAAARSEPLGGHRPGERVRRNRSGHAVERDGHPVGEPGWAAPADPAATPRPPVPPASGGPHVPGTPGWPSQPGVPDLPAQPAWTPAAYPPGPYKAGSYPPGPYPPPYAYPGMPPRRGGGGGWVAGLVIGLVTVLAIIVCGCVGLSFLGRGLDDGTASGDRYDGPL